MRESLRPRGRRSVELGRDGESAAGAGSHGGPADWSERVELEVGRLPPGPAYGPVVYFAPQHDPAVR